MRKYLLFSGFLLIVFFLTSCRPQGVLSQKEMTDLLFDIHLADALANPRYTTIPEVWTKGLEPDYFRDMSYQSVLRKHKVTEEEFFKSVKYYSKNLRLYTRIYEDIEKRMNAFSKDVTNWKYHKQTSEEFYKNAHLDTVKIIKLFSEQNYFKDTAATVRYSVVPDSVASWLDCKTREWLHELKTNKNQFYVVDPKDYVKILDLKVDSTAIKDSLKLKKMSILNKEEDILPEDPNEAKKPIVVF